MFCVSDCSEAYFNQPYESREPLHKLQPCDVGGLIGPTKVLLTYVA